MKIGLDSVVPRLARDVVNALIDEEPALLIEGPRGSGKSTLLREIADARGGRFVDLDDDDVLRAIKEDPSGVLAGTGLTMIDEFQRAPEVLSVVKRAVDRSRTPGLFVLAGSVSSGLLATGAETLTGRVHRMVLPPLSAGEILGSSRLLVPDLLASHEPPAISATLERQDYFDLIVAGGYPAALSRPTPRLRSRWYASYLSSVSERDLPELVELRYPAALARLYRAVAQNNSGAVSLTTLAESVGLSRLAARSYLDLLINVHLVAELPGWTVGVSAKATRRPKLYATDTGLASAAIGMEATRLASSGLAGAFVESFVTVEIAKQVSLADEQLTLSHFRDTNGVEVDLVLERPNGDVIGFEVKSATRINQADSRGLRFLRERLGDRFLMGVVFYTGPLSYRIDDRIHGLPVGALWGDGLLERHSACL